MSAADLALLLAVVLMAFGFAALVVALVRVSESMSQLRREIQSWRDQLLPLLDSMRESTDEAREVMGQARADLGRFDRVLGSAEAISDALDGTTRATRLALSTPVIKVAAFVSGTSRAARRLRSGADVPDRRSR